MGMPIQHGVHGIILKQWHEYLFHLLVPSVVCGKVGFMQDYDRWHRIVDLVGEPCVLGGGGGVSLVQITNDKVDATSFERIVARSVEDPLKVGVPACLPSFVIADGGIVVDVDVSKRADDARKHLPLGPSPAIFDEIARMDHEAGSYVTDLSYYLLVTVRIGAGISVDNEARLRFLD